MDGWTALRRNGWMGGAKIYAARSSADAAGGQAKTEQGEADQALGEKVQKKPFQANPAASKSEDVPRGKAGEAKKRTSRSGAAGARGCLHGFAAPRGGSKPGRSEKGQEKPWQANPAASKIEKVSRGRAGEAKKTYTALQCRRSCRRFSMFCRARRRAQNRAAAEKTARAAARPKLEPPPKARPEGSNYGTARRPADPEPSPPGHVSDFLFFACSQAQWAKKTKNFGRSYLLNKPPCQRSAWLFLALF